MNQPRLRPRLRSILIWTLVAIACIFRFVHLDSDPKFEYWEGYVTDEGRWTGTARNLALYGELLQYELARLHLVLAPGFQAANYLVFKLAGVSFWSARLWTAVSGSAILIVSLLALRRHSSGLPLYLGLGILGFEALVLTNSRVAIPEMASLLFVLLAFFTILTCKNSVVGALASGLLLAVAMAMKATAVLIAPVFFVLVWLSASPQSRSAALRSCGMFVAGLVTPVACGLLLAPATGVVTGESMLNVWSSLQNVFGLADPKTVMRRFLLSPNRRNVNLLLLGAWLGSWAWILRSEHRGNALHDLYRFSAIWAIGSLLIWSTLQYVPQRYLVHIIVPLVVHLVAGLALWQRLGPAHVMNRIDQSKKSAGIAFCAWLVLPTAVVVSTVALDVAGIIGIQEKLRYNLFAIAAAACILVPWVRVRRTGGISAVPFLVFPVVTAISWMAADEILENFLPDAFATHHLPAIHLMILSGFAWWCFGRSKSAAATLIDVRMKTLLASVVFAGLVAESAYELLWPTYSIRDASRSIGRLFPGDGTIRTTNAASFLLETKLRFREGPPWDAHDAGIIAYYQPRISTEGFISLAEYRLASHPLFCTRPDRDGARIEPCDAIIYVYRKVDAEQRPETGQLLTR